MYTSGGGGGELITGFIFCSQVHVNEPMTGVGGGGKLISGTLW